MSHRFIRYLFDHTQTSLYIKEIVRDNDGNLSFPFRELNKAQIDALEKESPDDVIGKTDFDMFDEESAEKTHKDEESLSKSGEDIYTEETLTSNSGITRFYKVHKGTFSLDGREFIWGESHDVTKEHAYEEELKRLARQDTLVSGFYNRAYGTLKIEETFTKKKRYASCALLITDLDRFKELNETYGHQVGDEAIRITGQRIQHTLRMGDRGNDIPVRLGGDEFCLFIADLPPEREKAEKDLEKICHRLQEVVKAPFSVNGRSVSTAASIGACLISPEERGQITFKEVYNQADIAMNRAKQEGRDTFHIGWLS